MSESKGIDWWDTWVPQEVRDNVKKNHEREASEGLPPRSDRLIDYTTFGELGHIVQENGDVYSGMLSDATRTRVPRVDRTRVVEGRRVAGRVELGRWRYSDKKIEYNKTK